MNRSRALLPHVAEVIACWPAKVPRIRRAPAALVAMLALSALTTWTPRAAAQGGPAPATTQELRLRGSRSQHALAVRLGADHLLASACARNSRCDPEAGERIALDPAAVAHRASASLERIALSPERELALVTVTAQSGRWVLLLGASLSSEPAVVRRPLVGWVDQPKGAPGAERRSILVRSPSVGGERIVTGTRHDAPWLCGRPATIRARELEPATMSWTPTAVDNLPAVERAAAKTIVAVPTAEPWPSELPRLLRATTTATGEGAVPTALTDGDLTTSWRETLAGPGANELVLMATDDAVAITGFDLVVRPAPSQGRPTAALEPPPAAAGASAALPTVTTPLPAAPRQLWLASEQRLVRVELPANAWTQAPATGYRIELPEPWRARCVALVLDTAASSAGDAAVTLAELRARTELDPLGADGIVRALDEEGPRAPTVTALLQRGGPEVFDAMSRAWARLGPAGRRHALDLVVSLPCADGATFLVTRLHDEAEDNESEQLLETARARLRGCGVDGAKALDARFRAGPLDGGQRRVAEELSLVAPATAVSSIVARLHEAPDELRASLRASLATALGMRRARPAVAHHLEPARFAVLPLVTRIDLLRALGARAATAAGASAALAQVVGADRSFRTRYLLLPVAGHLARTGDRAAEALLRAELTSTESPWLRAQAALAATGNPRFSAELGGALADDHPRVRQAALEAVLGTERAPEQHAAVLAKLLAADPWTFVRSATAAALGAAPSSSATEEALIDALVDPSPLVRQEVVRSLGRHGTEEARSALRAVAGRAKEPVSVRVAAIKALGQLCDGEAAELLTKLARRVAQPQLPYDRPLGLAALHALGAMHPPDLGDRLAPLLHPSVPEHVRQLAQAALRERSSCAVPAH